MKTHNTDSLPRDREYGFVMLGLLHRDPKGPELLDRWLQAIEPDVITLEFSHYGKTFREQMGALYRQRVEEAYNRLKKAHRPCYDNALSMVLSYVEMPYEFVTAARYGEAHGVPVHLLDMDHFSRLKLGGIEKLLGPENLERLLSKDMGEGAGYEGVLARLYFESGVKAVTYTEEMGARDRHMSNKIKVLKKRFGGKKLLHISGWRHLLDPHNFYGPLNPVKVFIYDRIIPV